MISIWDGCDQRALVIGLSAADLEWLYRNTFQPMVIWGKPLKMPADVVLLYGHTAGELNSHFRRLGLFSEITWAPLPHARIKRNGRSVMILAIDTMARQKLQAAPLDAQIRVPARRNGFEVLVVAGPTDDNLRRHLSRRLRLPAV